MATLGTYQTLAAAYNRTDTITFKIPETVPDGVQQVINHDGLIMTLTVVKGEVTLIKFQATNPNDPRYPGTFEGFEFGHALGAPVVYWGFHESISHASVSL